MKKNILFMIFGMAIMAAITIGVYAINASEIDYRNTKVDQALDALYTGLENKGINFNNIVSNTLPLNERIVDTTISANLTRGKYICSFTISLASANGTSASSTETANYNPIVTGCDAINRINGTSENLTGTTSFLKNSSNASQYINLVSTLYTFECDVNTDKTITVTHTTSAAASTHVPSAALIDCIEVK